jgi:four helix bundle protein
MVEQIRRVVLSVHFEYSGGLFKKISSRRKKYFEAAIRSVIEIDTALDIAIELKYDSLEQLQNLGDLIVKTFKTIKRVEILITDYSSLKICIPKANNYLKEHNDPFPVGSIHP